ncbi:CBO0543 family protein [Aquibacillus sediminis]|uniref:CBO0543 family protein n=1 Tax=Aquibacillus sediminis TaxID=2574734 RepID=UPI00110902CC|nr:CBO0543 family protein [Aquibacillus sediminis]
MFLVFALTVLVIDVLLAWKWGDWTNWKKYESSILYLISCDLAYNFLTYHRPLWEHSPTLLVQNHTIMNFVVMLVAYPSVLLVYLGRYPSKVQDQMVWVCFWAIFWTLFEWISIQLGEFKHFASWNIVHSLLFNFALFTMVRLHYKKSLLAYYLSIIIAISLLILFQIPVTSMK